jgi:hypothetical protein
MTPGMISWGQITKDAPAVGVTCVGTEHNDGDIVGVRVQLLDDHCQSEGVVPVAAWTSVATVFL